VKGFTDRLIGKLAVLNLRIRMPISGEINPRNFITKITQYERVCSMENSMTVLEDFFPIFTELIVKKRTGTYNCTNPGTISHNEILKLYREEINFIKPSVYSVVFNNDWYSRVGFIDKKELNREYNAIAGPDWPSWEKFLQHDFQGVPTAVKKEIASHNFAKRLATRTNTHPLPSEHLIYLEQVLPDLAIDQTTRLLVEQTTDAILKHKPLVKWWGKKCNPETF
jgi:hypothetical protein